MNVNIPILFVDKPSLDGMYIPKDVYCNILNDYFSFHDSVPVCIQFNSNTLNTLEEIGECIFYDLENKTANINLNDSYDYILEYLKDKVLEYVIAIKPEDIQKRDDGISVVTNGRLKYFVINDRSVYKTALNEFVYKFTKDQKSADSNTYQKINEYLESISLPTGINLYDYIYNEEQ